MNIRKGELFVGEDVIVDFHFVVAFILGADPTYSYIENGSPRIAYQLKYWKEAHRPLF